MREICTSGSEGGGAQTNTLSLPLSSSATSMVQSAIRNQRSEIASEIAPDLTCGPLFGIMACFGHGSRPLMSETPRFNF